MAEICGITPLAIAFFTVSAFRPETLEPLRRWLGENDLVPCAGTGKGA